MAAPPRTIELDEDMAFQRGAWRVERVGWGLMALILLAASLGLFGSGPLSETLVLIPQSSARIEYGRFQRQSSSTVVTIEVADAATAAGELVIAVNGEFLRAYDIRNIRPEPTRSVALADGIAFRIETAPRAPATIHFHLQTARVGFFRPSLTIAAGPAVELPVLIYP